jgi:predicted dehydrogenase
MSNGDLRAAVIGVGSFGRHHARIYAQMRDAGVRLVGLVDIDPVGPRELARQLDVPLVPCVEQLPEAIDVASIAVPTGDHRRIAEPLLRRGVHCLVEKPIAGSSTDARALVSAAEAGHAVLQVGLVERFNPVLAAVERLGGPPAFLEVHRLAPFSFRSADVGVVMDMMIHDLDILHHLVGEEASHVDAVGVPVISAHEDIASVRLTFPSGCVANVTASRVSLQRMRRIRIFSPDAYLSLDYDRREAMLVRRGPLMEQYVRGGNGAANGARRAVLDPAAMPDSPAFADLLDTERIPIHDAEPLREEIAALVAAIRNGRRPRVGGGEGLRALHLAERILTDLRSRPLPQPSGHAEPFPHCPRT